MLIYNERHAITVLDEFARHFNDHRHQIGVLQLIRTVCFVVEEVLAKPPDGTGTVDDLAWIEAVSVAELCIESCFRSDSLHHQLSRTAVELTVSYEVNIIDSDEPTDVDMNAYSQVRSQRTMPDGAGNTGSRMVVAFMA